MWIATIRCEACKQERDVPFTWREWRIGSEERGEPVLAPLDEVCPSCGSSDYDFRVTRIADPVQP